MPTIRFVKPYPEITVAKDSNLMKVLLDTKLPVASSCHGDGVCGKCKITVTNGAKNLSSPTELELNLSKKYFLKENQRISCQTKVLGDIEIDTSYW